MLRICWLFVAAGLIGCSLAKEKCGKYDPSKKGKEWPWLVNVFGDNQFRCIGTLVAKDRIITAARCIDPKAYASSDWQVGLATGKRVVVDKVFMHKEYVTGKDKASDIAILSLADPVEFSDAVMPVCQQGKGKEEKMTDCRTVQLILDVDSENGGDRQVVKASNSKKAECRAKTFDGFHAKDDDLLCVKMEQKDKVVKAGCDRSNVSPLYCREEKLWYLSGLALSCGAKDFPTAKSDHAWFLDVCNCMDDMVPAGQKEEESSGDAEGEEDDVEERPKADKEAADKEVAEKEAAEKEEAEEEDESEEVEEKQDKKAEPEKKKKENAKKESKEKKVSKDAAKRKEQMAKLGWAKKKKKAGKKETKQDA